MSRETVLVGAFSHETNTFAEPTDRKTFEERMEHVGDDVTEALTGTNTAVGGAIDVADDEDVELIQTVAASATPGGIVTAGAYDHYAGLILEGARTHADELDGVLLPLHGAMVAEGYEDGEGPLLTSLREILGEEIPIVVTLDLHGNVSEEMLGGADALVAFETYPHVDMGDTGRRGMALLVDAMRGDVDLVMRAERPPMLTFDQNTREGPMAEVMAYARELEGRDGVCKVSVLPGFHQADIPSMGLSIPVVTDGDPELATDVSRELASYLWERREEFLLEMPGPAEAVARARELLPTLEADDGPIVLADRGDNPGGGGAADGTTVLRELIDQGVENAGVAIMNDPEVVGAAIEAGVGERTTVTMGGKTDDLHGEPIEDLELYVRTITDGEFENTGPMGTGTENHLGRTALVACGENDGVSVIVTENRMQPYDAEIWRHVGLPPERFDVIVVKSSNHYRAAYEPLSSHIIQIDSVGLCANDLSNFEFAAIERPKYPLDELPDDAYPN